MGRKTHYADRCGGSAGERRGAAQRTFLRRGGEINADPYKQKYTNHIISINKNMSIYLSTDGYMDQFGGSDRKKLGMQKFKELILNNQHLSIQEQKEQFTSSYLTWKGNEQQIDDVLLIGVQL